MLQRTLIIVGILFILIGLFYPLIKDIGFGKLPGDIIVKRGNFSFLFPNNYLFDCECNAKYFIFYFFRK